MTLMSSSPSFLTETDGVGVYKAPPPSYVEWLASSKAFFDGSEWGGVLQTGVGAQRHYLWDSVYKIGHALTCFRRGPFYMGYLGFPVCAAPDVEAPSYDIDRMISAIRAMPCRPQLLRLPRFAFGGRTMTAQGRTHWSVETCITDLQAWRIDDTSVRRRDLNFARKRCTNMVMSNTAAGIEAYNIYAATVKRHRGTMRYTPDYFSALEKMSATSAIRTCVINDDAGLAGMVITVDHGKTCYYMHGGSRPDVLRLGVADLLLAHAIEKARERGLGRFNFLTSPAQQSGLIRFKEKWGGISLPAQTNDVPINLPGRVLIRLLA